jgi:hypothetical protein
MPRVMEPGFTGRVGDLIYYNMRGRQYVRTMPKKVKQTKATKASAGEFGRAAALGAAIRSQMGSIISEPKDNKMQTRLVTVLYQWLLQLRNQKDSKSIQPRFLMGFQFTEQRHSVTGRWMVGLNIHIPANGGIQIKIPAFVPTEVIKAPKDTASVVCRIAISVSDVADAFPIGRDATELIIEYNNKLVSAQTLSFKLNTHKGSLVATGISLEYKIAKDGYLAKNTNRNYMPSEIVHAVYL